MQINTLEFLRGLGELLLTWGVSATAGAGLAVLALRTWVSEKIRASIKSEYDEKLTNLAAQLKSQFDKELETHKAQLKSQGDVQIEELKSRLSIVAAQQQFKFSKLHELRLSIIAEVYQSLQAFVIALREYTASFEPVGIAPRPERQKTAVEAANAFMKLFSEKQIYIPRATAKKLSELRENLRFLLLQFQFSVDFVQRSGGADPTEKWLEITSKINSLSSTALVDLEDDLRRLFGEDIPTKAE